MLSMIRADGQLQRRSVVNVAMALLRRAQHVEEGEGEKPSIVGRGLVKNRNF